MVVSPDTAAKSDVGRGSKSAVPLLRLEGIGKSFGNVHALVDIDLDIVSGEVMFPAFPGHAGRLLSLLR